ncbi:hypothetical protein [uncultured Gammaproteobacteria bacterium]|nr:hypothetical protein [uncultured Gammaproteobacteria bacterium]
MGWVVLFLDWGTIIFRLARGYVLYLNVVCCAKALKKGKYM